MPPSITFTAASDASDTGGGYVLGSKWTAYKFSTKPNKYGMIHSKCHRQQLTGRKILLYVDNNSGIYTRNYIITKTINL